MKIDSNPRRNGFTLIETVIAIGVLAVLLTGFLIVFAPAAASIRKSLTSQDATRMVASFEQELVTLRGPEQQTAYATGFHKAFDFIAKSQPGVAGGTLEEAIMVYKYRGSLTLPVRADGTPEPVVNPIGDREAKGDDQVAGVHYVVRNMARRKSDPLFLQDLAATEGPVYLVKCTQLLKATTEMEMIERLPGQIANASNPDVPVATADLYEHAVLTFIADFYPLTSKTESYLNGQAFMDLYEIATRPLFSRNLAVCR